MESVIFVLDPKTIFAPEPGAIVISPSIDSWNNFGFRIGVDILFYHNNGPNSRLRLAGFFGFSAGEDENSDVRLLTKLLTHAPNNRLSARQVPNSFTMLPDMSAYREIVSFLGPKEAAKALVQINDVVACDEGLPGSTSLRSAKESAVFKKAFLRSSESFFAWAHAGPVLRGLEHEEIGQMSDTFNLNFQLDGRPNQHELSFSFDVRV